MEKTIRKVLAVIISFAMMIGMTACNLKKVEVPADKEVKKAVEEEYDMKFKLDSSEVSKDGSEAEWVFISKDETLEVTVTWNAKDPDKYEFDDEELEPEESEVTVTTTEETSEPAPTTTEGTTETTAKKPAEINGSIVNFDDMSFYISGKKYTLGKSTLQDMIDAGVPFEKSDIDEASTELEAKYQGGGFRINLADYYSVMIYVLNDTDSPKPMSECIINELYVPVSDIEQNIFELNFPLTLTMDELKANAGEPNNDIYHYEDTDSDYYSDTLKYSIESEIYLGGSSYQFDFVKGELRYFYMTWVP